MQQVIAVNVGQPREVSWKGKTVTTAIYKYPVAGRQSVDTLNISGDQQADLSVHGGVAKAVYAYPAEHAATWSRELPTMRFDHGSFGENLTTIGLHEDTVQIGASFRIGSAVLRATQPRLPCYKLNVRFEREDMVKRFLASRRTGIYFAVEQAGAISAGDLIEPIVVPTHGLTIAHITRVFAFDKADYATMRQLIALDTLIDDWRTYFSEQLAAHGQA